MLCTPSRAQVIPATTNHPAPNVNSAQVKKACLEPRFGSPQVGKAKGPPGPCQTDPGGGRPLAVAGNTVLGTRLPPKLCDSDRVASPLCARENTDALHGDDKGTSLTRLSGGEEE